MATIGKMIRGSLPPVGERVSLRSSHESANALFPDFTPYFVQSGTAALALALRSLLARARSEQRKVAIPGYACPDLISAIVFCELEPVLVDLQEGDCCMDLSTLNEELDQTFLAVIAVNFLGIRERVKEIQDLPNLVRNGVAVIEDSAQWFPENIDSCELSDLVCLSFGRGKPVSLLGGGVLLVRNGSDIQVGPLVDIELSGLGKFKFALKCAIYNTLLLPFFYQFLVMLPFLNIGKTYYKPLDGIYGLPKWLVEKLGNNIDRHIQRSRSIEAGWIRNLPEPVCGLINERVCGRLLRFPALLHNQVSRNRVFNELNRLGLGVSKLYEKTLNEFDDIRPLLRKAERDKSLVNAKKLAGGLLTLPTHSRVRGAHSALAQRIVGEAF